MQKIKFLFLSQWLQQIPINSVYHNKNHSILSYCLSFKTSLPPKYYLLLLYAYYIHTSTNMPIYTHICYTYMYMYPYRSVLTFICIIVPKYMPRGTEELSVTDLTVSVFIYFGVKYSKET